MKIKLLLILNLLLIFSFNLQAQVTASFTADVTQGCAPIQVNFQNTSSGSGTLTYLWNFGNGNTSIVQNPSTVIYSNSGVISVTLTVSNGTQSDTDTLIINVFALPTAQFTSGVHIGCDQLTVQFTDQSTGATTWSWDFDDGTGSNLPSPSHTYSNPGYYTVSLHVTNANGCYDDFFINDYVIVSQTPSSTFSADVTSYCLAPITINFSNTQSVPGIFTYNWTFGDGGTANTQNPSHLYDTIGLYDVSLTVTDQYGCESDTSINDYINLTTVTSSFFVTEGDTVCPYQYIHLNNTSGISGEWIYPDGTISTVDSLTFNPGFVGNISFIAAPGICADTSTKQIVVTTQPVANFSINEPYGCEVLHDVQFTNLSPTAVIWEWSFGDGENDTIANPAHTYSSQGTFPVGLTITNQMGCKNSFQDNVTITFPVATFTNDTNLGCIPLPISFTDASTCNTTFDNIPTWNWNFGDPTSGVLNTSTIQNPTHIYATDGDFTINLTITTGHGCSASSSMIVNIGSHQNLAFTIDTIVACAQDTIKITNLTQDTLKIDTYAWTFGSSMTSDLLNPLPFVLKNTVDTGWAEFKLITNYNGCRDTLIDSVWIKGPVIKTMTILTSLMHCGYDSSYVYYLTTNTQGAEYWKWNWRDSIGSPTDSVINDTLRHQYLTSGNRTVSIWAYNDSTGCIYKDSIIVKPRDIHANIDSLTLLNDTICYYPNGFTGDILKDAVFWKWKFGDATPTTAWSGSQPTAHTFDTSGYYLVWMYARTDNELVCIDSTSKYVRVFKPEVEFYADTLIGCAQSPITVPFHSTSFSPDTNIVAWNWYYQLLPDNTFYSFSSSSDSIPIHDFNIAGKYNIKLQVMDGFGCSDSITKSDYITSLEVTANLTIPQFIYCTNDSIIFTSTSTAFPLDYPPIDFHWFFGNGDSSYLPSPKFPYPVKGTYDVMLVVYDTLGCYDTITKNDYIEAQAIIASFTSDTSSTCYPFIPTIVNNTLLEYNPSFLWSFGDGATSTNDTVVHKYNMQGDYYMVLEVTTSNQCKDKDSILIHVGGPYAAVTVDKTQICKGETVTFTIADTVSIANYTWDFGDGFGADTTSPYSHPYAYVPPTGQFHVTLFYRSSDLNCKKADSSIYINVYQVVAGFDRMQQGSVINDTSGCNPLPIVFTNTSTGSTAWSWDFGDGDSSISQTPSPHPFNNSTQNDSTYIITLIIQNGIGCTDTAMKKVVVYPTPSISLRNDTIMCLGNNIVLLSSGGDTVRWDYEPTLSNDTIHNPVATPTITTTYTATVTSNYGCFKTDSVKITVQQVPVLTTNNDTTVIIGEYVDMYAISDQQNSSFQWIPFPIDNSMTCTNCPEPTVRPLKNTNYNIKIADSLGCFSVEKIVKVIVDARFTVDVPKVFTPNNDGHNDLIFAKGWGVESIKQFKIFNRWGQLVFETNDLHAGWDGMFNGKMQPSDTYTYFVELTMLDGSSLSKKGVFDLLR